MTRKPVVEPGMALLPAGAIAAFTGGVVGATLTCWNDNLVGVGGYVAMIFFSTVIAFVLGGLAAPPLAKRIIGSRPVNWGNSALAATLGATVPATLFVLVQAPLADWRQEPFSITDAATGLAMLALSGAVAGLVFRACYGPRTIEPR